MSPCPADQDSARTPLYGPEFAADPHAVYERLRRAGPVARISLAPGVPAVLVLSYWLALDVLRDPDIFRKDPRLWQASVPASSPIAPLTHHRPNCLHTDGAEHARYRSAVSDTMGRINSFAVRPYVERAATQLIHRFQAAGQADLLADYATRLPLLVFQQLFGCPRELADRLLDAMAAMFDGRQPQEANAELTHCVLLLIAHKRAHPADDMTSWLISHHTGLTDTELVHQLALLMGAGTEPEANWISNTLLLLLTDERFAGDVTGGTLSVSDALDEGLWTNPAMANFGITYPRHDLTLAGMPVPAHTPIVISFAAANTDPAFTDVSRVGNRSHLAFSAGPHTCPAQQLARLIATVAIETLLDTLPDLALAIPTDHLRWRQGPFHRALTALPVRFPPLTAPAPDLPSVRPPTSRSLGGSSCTPHPASTSPLSLTPPAVTSTPKPPASAPAAQPPR